MTQPYSISELNQMSQDTFTAALGAVFEDTPAIAHHAWNDRPFEDVSDLHQKMVQIVQHMSLAEQLALIKAHPDLGSKAQMAAASVQEQAGAGLDQLTPEEYDRIQALNQSYKEKFGFPFITTVRTQTKASIFAAFDRRLQNTIEAETQQALAEIAQIARLRLLDLLDNG
ncbi:MAG: 2-oxo-4-hydroxy-4-carboxy-5-ureidoimidazoline decarboxylase [Oscillatoriophycideae cyanobacterium NC_groundwater_1537_Pr4_S-0.65um_50_18]|nr:2-oxo-4-hydroxy-4-carboxy-5-ureidoimidazoline decarboxylase [Oscillatoriophycideae cyanobacterium NC_groundwater_1537_Pr4_S-0.65um_50_18]